MNLELNTHSTFSSGNKKTYFVLNLTLKSFNKNILHQGDTTL